jgi:RND superfamily putative drug exporter
MTNTTSSQHEARNHKGIAPRAARWSAAHRKKAIFGFLAFVAVAAFVGQSVGNNQLTDLEQFFVGESRDAEQTLDDAGLRPNKEVVLVQSDDLTVGDPEFATAIEEVSARLSKLAYVENVVSPLVGKGEVTADRHAALVNFEIAGDSNEAQDRVGSSLAATAVVQAQHPNLVIEQFGEASANKAVSTVGEEDVAKAGQLSLPITLIILVLTFGTLVAAGLPLLIGITSVVAATGLVAIPSQILPIDPNVSAVILMIGLAVGVDYALFYLRREREERAAGRDPQTALEIAAATSGRAVLISGLTVMVAMAGMFISGDKAFISFAYSTMIVVAIAMFASLTVLPAMLSWLGDRVEKGRIPFIGRRRRPAGESRFWSGLTERVLRRPLLSVVLAGGLLVALAIPALHMKTVISSVEDLPQDIAVIQTYNQVRDAFPSEGVTTDVVVKAGDVRSGDVADEIAALQQEVEGSDAFLPGSAVTYSADNTVAEIVIPTPGSGTDQPSTNALTEIRGQIIPATVGGVDGASVDVTGDAAATEDSRAQSNSRLPWIFAFVFGLAFLLMLITFRSIVIPIKAILLNLLSVGAAYGVLVLVFQDGHGESLLGFTSNGGVASWLPLFLFVILFGLSMDYHVFILSRVKELYDGGMNTGDAVRQAISTTAGTVTSAAVVMVAVFAVFATLTLLDLKELGVGLAAAILIDATIIRGVLLPATMKLLGDWNWYLPSWLEWLPRFGSHDAGGEVSPPLPPPRPDDSPKPAPVPV